MVRRGLTCAVLASALAALACDRGGSLDQADLKAAMSADESTSRASRQADDAARAGREVDAVDLLKRVGEPAALAALNAANALAPRTAWGEAEKKSLVSLTSDRKSELERYEAALRGGSDDDKLEALTKQVDIEKRAVSLAQEINRGPDSPDHSR